MEVALVKVRPGRLRLPPMVRLPVMYPLLDRESDVPWAFPKEKFWREEEAVVLVAKILEVPMIGDSRPPEYVLVAEEVEVMKPAVRDPEVMFAKTEETERKIEEKKEVEVAFVIERLVKVDVAVEVAVR